MRHITGAILMATSSVYAFLSVWAPETVYRLAITQMNPGHAFGNANFTGSIFALIGLVLFLLGLYFLLSKDKTKN